MGGTDSRLPLQQPHNCVKEHEEAVKTIFGWGKGRRRRTTGRDRDRGREEAKGPFTYDVRKFCGIFEAPPFIITLTQPVVLTPPPSVLTSSVKVPLATQHPSPSGSKHFLLPTYPLSPRQRLLVGRLAPEVSSFHKAFTLMHSSHN